MEVTVNQQLYIVPQDCSVQTLLSDVLRQPERGLAIAINETIVSRPQWETHRLHPTDNIIIIKATQGG